MPAPRVTTQQIKAARVLLGWSRRDLAAASGISMPTIKRMESRIGDLRGRPDTAARTVSALETAGVAFIEENGVGVGVRLRGGRMPDIVALENLNASNDQ